MNILNFDEWLFENKSPNEEIPAMKSGNPKNMSYREQYKKGEFGVDANSPAEEVTNSSNFARLVKDTINAYKKIDKKFNLDSDQEESLYYLCRVFFKEKGYINSNIITAMIKYADYK